MSRSDVNCAWLVSIENCFGDYDIITVEGDTLACGKRTGNMCSESGRPTEKGTPMKRIID